MKLLQVTESGFKNTVRTALTALGIILSVNSYAQVSELIWGDPVKLPATINSPGEEALLVFSRDSSTLFFVRQFFDDNTGGNEDQDIYYSKRGVGGIYDAAKNLKALNNKDFNAVVGVSLDGNTVYLYNAYVKKKNQLDRGIAVAKKRQ